MITIDFLCIAIFFFEGDLLDEQRVLSWLTSQDVFEIKDEIEEVNRKMLDKLLDENEFVSVYFCTFPIQTCFQFLLKVIGLY
jgi:hypothetical protein